MNTQALRNSAHLAAALELASQGWNVFPLRQGTKTPAISKKAGGRGAHDGTTDPAQIRRWWVANPSRGIGANLGTDRIAFDIDKQHGGEFLKSFPPTRTHYSGRGNGNAHLIYRYAPGSLASRMKSGTDILGLGIDVRIGEGSYIVMPPTLHEDTRQPYAVGAENGAVEHVLTDDELRDIYAEAGQDLPRHLTEAPTPARRGGLRPVATTPGSVLQDLLDNPPAEGGRNDWLARVCGHLAKQHRSDQDEYIRAVESANTLLPQPLDAAKVEKTYNSIWTTEQEQHPERQAGPDNGYLVPHGGVLYCTVQVGKGEEAEYVLVPWSDFDLTTSGVAVDDNSHRVYWVTLNWNGEQIRSTLSGETLSDDRAFKKWLGAFGASYDTPPNAIHKISPATRMLRYLNSQKPPRVSITQTLGYQAGDNWQGFVTPDGLITPDGMVPKEIAGVVLDPELVRTKIANFHYGMEGTRQEAVNVLSEVLTFQEENTVAMFAAWWGACLLKPQISDHTSLFPIMGVEAASESGKTTGFFDLMVQLNGNRLGHVTPTRPVLRDYASANRNGIVWVDDLDDLSPYEELLRASTTNGSVAKMDSDNNGVKARQIVSPIFVSGESLGFNNQKALADRAVVVHAPSPKNRRGANGNLQWEDIVSLQNRYRAHPQGLSVLAGWFVLDALRWQFETVQAVTRYKGKGRTGSKYGVLIAGACLVQSILEGAWTESGHIVDRVKRWASSDDAAQLEQDNTMTREILPWAIRYWNTPDAVSITEGGRMDQIKTPVVIREPQDVMSTEPEIWYSTTLLADAWERHKAGRVKPRTESSQALMDQAKALGGERKSFKVTSTRQVVKMRRLPSAYVGVVLERAGVQAD